MCDPLTIAGLALSTAGGIGQGQTKANFVDEVNAQNKRAYAMSQQAREAERTRQRAFETEQNAKFDETAAGMSRERFDADQAANVQNFTDMLAATPAALAPGDLLPGGDTASTAVQADAARQTAKAAADTRKRVKALAELTSYGTTGGGRARDFAGAADFVSTLGGLRRGSLGVSRQEQAIQPADVTPGNSTFADILSGVGGIMSYGGKNLFKNGMFQNGITVPGDLFGAGGVV